MMSAKQIKAFKGRLVELGGELLAPTNEYEVMRFKTKYGVGVVYRGKRGETWNPAAERAREHVNTRQPGKLSPVKVVGRRKNKATVDALIKRDGETCFFCGCDLGDSITVEHLVPIAHGGPNHISNLFLAHYDCNNRAGHLSAPEKVKLAIELRAGVSVVDAVVVQMRMAA